MVLCVSIVVSTQRATFLTDVLDLYVSMQLMAPNLVLMPAMSL